MFLIQFDYERNCYVLKHAPIFIADRPFLSYRGLLIDSSRHFLPLRSIKRIIDAMAWVKLNVLHWHLVDDEAFPFFVPSVPTLWKGAFSSAERYTAWDIEEIVAYAKARGVHVVAETDVPGHAASWCVGSRRGSPFPRRSGAVSERRLPLSAGPEPRNDVRNAGRAAERPAGQREGRGLLPRGSVPHGRRRGEHGVLDEGSARGGVDGAAQSDGERGVRVLRKSHGRADPEARTRDHRVGGGVREPSREYRSRDDHSAVVGRRRETERDRRCRLPRDREQLQALVSPAALGDLGLLLRK